jgi:hypothetical protein
MAVIRDGGFTMERVMRRRQDGLYYDDTICSWEQLLERLKTLELEGKWIFKGLLSEWRLHSTLDRAFLKFNIDRNDEQAPANAIEKELIRDFQRLYDGNDRQAVLEDTLYCISLMQHHGAPTRLMDWTYSPFIAAYFALEYAHDADKKKQNDGKVPAAIWCFNTEWCKGYVKQKPKIKSLMDIRLTEVFPPDCTFIPLYMPSEGKPFTFVYPENPYLLHTRLARQQGVFLCPSDVSKSFEVNLKKLGKKYRGSDDEIKDSIYEIRCKLTREDRIKALNQLHRMNIDRSSLFPGLDGFAKSMNYRFGFYQKLAQAKGMNNA